MNTYSSKLNVMAFVMILFVLGLGSCKKDGAFLHSSTTTYVSAELAFIQDKDNVYKIQLGDNVLSEAISLKNPGGSRFVKYINTADLKGHLKVWRLTAGGEILELDVVIEAVPKGVIRFVQSVPGGTLHLSTDFTSIKANLWMAPATSDVYLVKYGETVIGKALTTGNSTAKIDSGYVLKEELNDFLRVWKVENGVPTTLLLEKQVELEAGQTINLLQATADSPIGTVDHIEIPDTDSKTNMLFSYTGIVEETPDGIPGTGPQKIELHVVAVDYDDLLSHGTANRPNFATLTLDTVVAITLSVNELSEMVTIDLDHFKPASKKAAYFYYSIRDGLTGEMLQPYTRSYILNNLAISGIKARNKFSIMKLYAYGYLWPDPTDYVIDVIGSEPW